MDFSPSFLTVPYHEYMKLPPSCHPILFDGYEICPSLIATVRTKSFSGRMDECPYAHLQEFEENCALLTIPRMNRNTLWWKLFLISLMGNAKIWYNWKAVRVGDWIQLKDEVCLFFSYLQSDPTSYATAIIQARWWWNTWSSVDTIHAVSNFRTTP